MIMIITIIMIIIMIVMIIIIIQIIQIIIIKVIIIIYVLCYCLKEVLFSHVWPALLGVAIPAEVEGVAGPGHVSTKRTTQMTSNVNSSL